MRLMPVLFFSSAAWSTVAAFVSARRPHPLVFPCIERSHPSHACIFPLASFDTRTALYVAVLVHHLFSPRSCDLTVSAINRGVPSTRNCPCLAIGEGDRIRVHRTLHAVGCLSSHSENTWNTYGRYGRATFLARKWRTIRRLTNTA
ncbi:hypothetical protein BJV78DRAFT_513956 [Lactifluus subvellereus]|nr:hypothetical protein BJV78DRAFT_513956 [Lactifluus subvellereus]